MEFGLSKFPGLCRPAEINENVISSHNDIKMLHTRPKLIEIAPKLNLLWNLDLANFQAFAGPLDMNENLIYLQNNSKMLNTSPET